MKTLKTVKSLAHEIHSTFASAYAIGEKVNPEWLENVLTAYTTDIIEMIEGMKIKESHIGIGGLHTAKVEMEVNSVLSDIQAKLRKTLLESNKQ